MVLLAIGTIVSAQNDYHITVESKKPVGIIDEMLYGQLFEHIYFSANNGVWQELIQAPLPFISWQEQNSPTFDHRKIHGFRLRDEEVVCQIF